MKFKKNNICIVFNKRIVFGLLLVCCPSLAHADEGGQTPYPGGLNTIAAGFVPAPGTGQYYMYNKYTNNYKFTGSDGNKLLPVFGADSLAVVPRYLYTLSNKLGPFTVTVGGSVTFLDLHMHAGDNSGKMFGVTNTNPEIRLGWHNKEHNLFVLLGFDMMIPGGPYNSEKLANVSENYWTFQPNFDFTYFPTNQIEIDSSSMVHFNTTNPATHYHSGSNVMSDFAVNYFPLFSDLPNLFFGATGYVQRQIQDDTQSGHVVETVFGQPVSRGFRTDVNGIGPQIGLRLMKTGGILVKYTHNFGAQNASKGEAIWFELSMPIS